MKAKVYATTGEPRKKQEELPPELFDGTVNQSAMHQVVTALLANQRQGTHATKTRQTIRGGNSKPWRQKGTGRARAGSIRSPLWRGGAVVFGPQPRSYRTRVPKKLKRLATQSALNARAMEERVLLVEPFEMEAPRTRAIAELLQALEVADGNTLLLTDGTKPHVYLSGRNIPGVLVKAWGDASAYDVLWSDTVIVERSALAGVRGSAASPESEDEEVES